MKTIFIILILINVLDFSLSEKLECYECSQTSNSNKCTENPTRTKKATDDEDYLVCNEIFFKIPNFVLIHPLNYFYTVTSEISNE